MSDNGKTYLALTATMVFWGLSFVATKIALQGFPTFTLVFIRFFFAFVLFCFIRRVKKLPSFSKKDHMKMFLLALFEPGFYFIFETIGLQYTTAPKASLIIATIPVVVLVFSRLFLAERAAPSSIAGIFLSFAGIVILVAGSPDVSWQLEGVLMGDLLIMGAVLSAALYIVSARSLGKTHSAIDITFMQIGYGALFYAPFFFMELPRIDWHIIGLRPICALAYLIVFPTVGAFLCYNYALTRIQASKAAVVINGIPVVTAIGAWILLNETLTLFQAGGGAMVLAAVFLTNLPSGKAKRILKKSP